MLKTFKVWCPYYGEDVFYEFEEINPGEAAVQFWPYLIEVGNDEWFDALTYTNESYGVVVYAQERDSNEIHKFLITREITYNANKI